MALDPLISLVNLILSLLTLGLVVRFWWRHRMATFARAWWIMALAFGLFAVSETFGAAVLFEHAPPTNAIGLTIRFLFMSLLIVGLSRLFEDVLQAQQRALDEAQKTIQMQTEAVARAREVETLAHISERLTASLELETVLQELCRSARELTEAASVSVRLPAGAPGEFTFAVDFASALKTRPERLDPKLDQLSWRVYQAGRPAIIEDAKAHPLFGPDSPAWMGALAAFPLRQSAEVIGILTLVFDEPRRFPQSLQKVLAALADHAAVAVRNAQLHEAVEQSARTDPLTGLANRRSFNEALTAEIRRAQRYHAPFALIMADVDRLKSINDTYGHVAGDTLLRAVAEALRNGTRATDLAARFGGDEFVVILPSTSLAEAQLIARRILQEAERLSFDWNGALIPVHLSLGVAGGQAGALPEAGALLAAADEDLYRGRAARHYAREAAPPSASASA